MIDTGSGPPVVLIPGIQGRWEWMAPAIEALSRSHRVLSFSLGEALEGPAPGQTPFEAWLATIDTLIDRATQTRAAVIGVSFGGLIAARYAASRPSRV